NAFGGPDEAVPRGDLGGAPVQGHVARSPNPAPPLDVGRPRCGRHRVGVHLYPRHRLRLRAPAHAPRAARLREGWRGDGRERPGDRMERHWYAVHTYSGHENKVKTNIERRAQSLGLSEMISRIVVPTEEELRVRAGKRTSVRRKIFPGYVLIEMVLD